LVLPAASMACGCSPAAPCAGWRVAVQPPRFPFA
jgi:hypothetical protein